jgi:hypothetical protein
MATAPKEAATDVTPARRAAIEAEQVSRPPTPPALAHRAQPAAPKPPKLDAVGCHNCKLWLPRGHINAQEPLGACRRYPPAGAGMRPGEFPLTKASSWCGEHAQA